jgi:hypothetical protein
MLGERIIAQQAFISDDKVQLTILSGLLRSNISAIAQGMDVAFANNPSGTIQPALSAPLQDIVTANEALLESINRDLIYPSDLTQFNTYPFIKALDPAARPGDPMTELDQIRGFFPPAHLQQSHPQIVMSFGKIRPYPHGLRKLACGLGEISHSAQSHSQGIVRLRVAGSDVDSGRRSPLVSWSFAVRAHEVVVLNADRHRLRVAKTVARRVAPAAGVVLVKRVGVVEPQQTSQVGQFLIDRHLGTSAPAPALKGDLRRRTAIDRQHPPHLTFT